MSSSRGPKYRTDKVIAIVFVAVWYTHYLFIVFDLDYLLFIIYWVLLFFACVDLRIDLWIYQRIQIHICDNLRLLESYNNWFFFSFIRSL